MTEAREQSQEPTSIGRIARYGRAAYRRVMRLPQLLLVLLALSTAGCLVESRGAEPQAEAFDYDAMRAELVRQVAAHAKSIGAATGVAEIDPRVLKAIAAVPRHEFLPEPLRPLAYLNVPLPIGHDQNIAQPYLVALMTHLVGIKKGDVVFETGTGAGYHAAVLARLAGRVYSVEVVAPLAEQATATLRRLGYDNVEVLHSDGYYGWREHGPYDAIILKEAVNHVPAPLLNQLKRGGRMVAPVGRLDDAQQLMLIRKDEQGRIHQQPIMPVRFSPLQGGERI